jgi:ATP-binding cassette subfamily F protein uup
VVVLGSHSLDRIPGTAGTLLSVAVLVDLEEVSVRRGDRTLFHDLSLTVSDGDRVGVVGINGTGKSTLLRVVAGVEQCDSGQVRRGRGVRTGYLEQEATLPAGSVQLAVGPGWEAEAALDRLGMGATGDTEVSELSGGQAKRVALAAVLARPVELLVLDEPTNHLDLRAVAWLEQWLLDLRGGLVLVTHDRHLLDRVTTRMIELDRGRAYEHEGGYASYLAASAEREAQAASSEASRRNLARRELAWLRRGAPARTRKPRARIEAALRVSTDRAEPPARPAELEIAFGTPRLGDKVIECAGVGYSYGHCSAPVLSGVDLVLAPSERLGLVGANGSGKSTLLDLLAGRRSATCGRLEYGPTVVTGYYDQAGVDLDPSARVRELVAGSARVPGAPEDVALMERFWFTGSLQFAPTHTLSGGERRRLQLLLVLAARPNVLLLDEPTNDLDLDTLRILEDFLEDWPGALVVVSHDRTFLARTTERLMALEAGTVAAIAGDLDAWIARAQYPAEAPPSVARHTRAAGVRVPTPEPRRSPSTTGRQLREAEREMGRLARRRDELSEALMAAGDDHLELARLGQELAEVQDSLTESENRWLALAEEADEAR